MREMPCEVIQDLLPLYADESLSEASTELVEEHLSGCAECRIRLEDMKQEVPVPRPTVDEAALLRQIKRGQENLMSVTVLVTLLLVFCVGAALVMLSPLIRGLEPANIDNLTVTETEDGSVLITPDDRARGQRIYYLYQVEEDGSMEMYIGFWSDIQQYWRDVGLLLPHESCKNYIFEPYAWLIEKREDGARKTVDGGVKVIMGPPEDSFVVLEANSWAFNRPNSILITNSVDRIYYLDDFSDSMWEEFFDCMLESRSSAMNTIDTDEYEVGEYVVPMMVEGFDFDALEDDNVTLLWERTTD